MMLFFIFYFYEKIMYVNVTLKKVHFPLFFFFFYTTQILLEFDRNKIFISNYIFVFDCNKSSKLGKMAL